MTIMDYEHVSGLWGRVEGISINCFDDTFEGISRFLKRNPSSCFVAEHKGEILGAILGGHDGRRGHIYHASVDTDRRNQGVGRALVNAVVSAFRSEGITKASIAVFRSNDSGNSFWLRNGWEKRLDLNYYSLRIGPGNSKP